MAICRSEFGLFVCFFVALSREILHCTLPLSRLKSALCGGFPPATIEVARNLGFDDHWLEIAPVGFPFFLAAHTPNSERANDVPLECGPIAFVDFQEMADQPAFVGGRHHADCHNLLGASPVLNRVADGADRVDASKMAATPSTSPQA
jgi:hypothetical protein